MTMKPASVCTISHMLMSVWLWRRVAVVVAAISILPPARTRPRRSMNRAFPDKKGFAAGVEVAGRCWARWLSQRRQVHAGVAHLSGQAQDCRLSFHHAATKPWGRHDW